MTAPDVVVLPENVHGMDPADLVAAIAERVPDREVVLARTRAEARDRLASATVAVGVHLDDDLLAAADDLAYFQSAFAGTDHLPLDALAERGVAVASASGVHGPNVAEHAIGAVLAFVRRFGEARRRQARREWRHFRAGELQGSTVTVAGLGAIGRAVVERLEGFGVEVVGARYTPKKGGPTEEVVGLGGPAFEAALARTDYLVLACPLTDATRGLVDAAALETLPATAVLVNVARGPVVDTGALVSALRDGRIRGAALDVTDPEPLPADHPLWTFENVLVTPHNAGHTPRYWERLADVVAENLRRADETGRYDDLRNRVA